MTSFINRIFRKKTSINTPVQVSPTIDSPSTTSDQVTIIVNNKTADVPPRLPLDISQLIVGVAQSAGIQRDRNEDALFTLSSNLAFGEKNQQLGLFIIADGMGGHENGELASQLAVEKFTSHVFEFVIQPQLSIVKIQSESSIQEIVKEGVINAHLAIKKEALGGGSTLTAALILGDQMTIAHVGDSRAYLFTPDGNVQQLTHDHTLVKRLEEIGQISPEEASTHPDRNVLYRAVGQGELTEPDVTTLHLQKGSRIILCTDGLWGVISEKELANAVSSFSEPQQACQALVNLANTMGGPDNISVILIDIPE